MKQFNLAAQTTLTVKDIADIFSFASTSARSLAVSDFIIGEMQRKLGYTADSSFMVLNPKENVNDLFFSYNMNPNYLYLPLQAEIYFKNFADNQELLTCQESKNEYVKACARSALVMLKAATVMTMNNGNLGLQSPSLEQINKPILKIVAGATDSSTIMGLESLTSRFPSEYFSYLSMLNWAAVEFTSQEDNQ